MRRIALPLILSLFALLLSIEARSSEPDPVTGLIAKTPTVYMLTTNGCPPCERWRKEVQPWIESSGQWTVTDVYGVRSKRFPTFRIWTGKRWLGHEGYMPRERFRQLLGGK